MEARHSRVLVDQRRGLQRPVRVRLIAHRVDQAQLQKAWRRDRKRREDDHSDGTGQQHRVAIDHEPVRRPPVQPDEDGDDHRPMAPDVHPVGDGRQDLGVHDRLLKGLLGVDAGLLFESDHPIRVAVGDGRIALRERSNAEVRHDRSAHDGELSRRMAEALPPGIQVHVNPRTSRWRCRRQADPTSPAAPESRAPRYRDLRHWPKQLSSCRVRLWP